MILDTTAWYLISFVIFIAAVFKPIKNLVMSSLDAKADQITHNLKEAEKIKEEASQMYREAEKKLVEAEFTATEIINHAKTELLRTRMSLEDEVKSYAEKHERLLQQRIHNMYENAKSDIHNHIVDVSITTASSVIEARLKDEKNVKYAVHELKRVKHLGG